MKKYNVIRIVNTEGITEFEGSYTKLLSRFNSKEECAEYIDNCKEKGYDYSSRTNYYDFEYDGNNTGLSDNWFEDIKCEICYDNTREMIEEIIKKSFKNINNVRCDYIGDFLLVVLPKQYDSLILKKPFDVDYKFFRKLLREIHFNMNGRHNKTNFPKILVSEFVNDWRTKIQYADYHEGYTFYYNSKPQENKLQLLLR